MNSPRSQNDAPVTPPQDGFYPALPGADVPTTTLSPIVSLPSDFFDTPTPIATVFTEPVTTTFLDQGQGWIQFQGDFTYDSAIVSFDATPAEPAGLTAAGWAVSGTIINSGPGSIKTLHITATGSSALNGSGTLFNLRMVRVSTTPGDTTSLVWNQSPTNFRFGNAAGGQYAPVQNSGAITINLTVSLPIKSISTTVPLATDLITPVKVSRMNPFHNYVGFQGDFTFDSSRVNSWATLCSHPDSPPVTGMFPPTFSEQARPRFCAYQPSRSTSRR